jgi:DnaJ family protein A protein 2
VDYLYFFIACFNQYMNPYKTLGVSQSSSGADIKKAYRDLAKIHHPDKGGDSEQFKKITRAYEVLSDNSSKKYYDMTGKMPDDKDTGDDLGNSMGMGGSINISELFGGLFGGMGMGMGMGGAGMGAGVGGGPFFSERQEKQEKPPPRTEKISLTLSQLFSGHTFKICANRSKLCTTCNGSGAQETEICELCTGTGACVKVINMGGLIMQSHSVCFDCRGEGKKTTALCQICSGSGKIKEEREIDIVILPGTAHDEKIVFPEICSEIDGYKKAGDLIMVINEIQQENWTRKHDDLHTYINLNVRTALVGGTIYLDDHPSDKQIPVIIPPGTFTGDVIMISELGMPNKKGLSKGNLYVNIGKIAPEINERELIRKHYRSLSAIFDTGGDAGDAGDTPAPAPADEIKE